MRKSTAPPLDRGDRFVDAAEAGHDHRANLRVAVEGLVEHRHAVGIGQAEVDDEAVVGEPAKAFDGVGGVARLGGGEPVGFEIATMVWRRSRSSSTTRMDGRARWLIDS